MKVHIPDAEDVAGLMIQVQVVEASIRVLLEVEERHMSELHTALDEVSRIKERVVEHQTR